VTLRKDCRLDLGTVLVLISTYTFMAECNRILEKTVYCVASLTVSAQILLELWERGIKANGVVSRLNVT